MTQVTAEGQRVVVRFIGPGEMFGCVAVFGGRHYPGTAMAVEDCCMIGFTKGAMQHLMERYPRLALNTLGTLGGRLQETQTRLREISTERVERRIAHALIRLAEQTGKRVAGGIRIDFAISRQDVAEMTGTTLHTVSRTLSSWEGQGIVEGGRQRITIREPAALIAIPEDRPTSAQRFRVIAPEQRRAEPPPSLHLSLAAELCPECSANWIVVGVVGPVGNAQRCPQGRWG